MRINRLIIAVLFLLPLRPAFSQVAQGARFEIPIFDSYSRPYATISLGEQGILIYATVIADGFESLEVTRIDTALNEVWKGYINVDKHARILRTQSSDGKALILLKDRFNSSMDFTLLVID